jgi:predicted RNA-binding protein YlqC (UPF0109 family)
LVVNPTDHEEVREWLLMTIRLVVDEPERVVIDAIPGEERTTFRIKVSAGDRGKVIGRQGRTSQSLRVLAGAMGKNLKWRFIIEIDEGVNPLRLPAFA